MSFQKQGQSACLFQSARLLGSSEYMYVQCSADLSVLITV